MPRKASVKGSNVHKNVSFFSQIKWGESYTSLFLGAVVVVIALILLFSFIKAKNAIDQQTGSASTQQTGNMIYPSSYVVKQGDDLWSIANKIYGSGYNWVDLANANNLSNPNILFVGTSLKVPNVKPKIVQNQQQTVSMEAIKSDSYTVVKGDNLWDISIRAYGDGYKWVEIAKANNLSNPNLIFSGNVFKIPR